jgi:head-tail adaptor
VPVGPTRKGAGQRRHHATLEEAIVTTDVLGGRAATSWESFGRWWVAINELPFFKDEKEASQTYQVTGPYRADVVEKHADKIMLRVVGGGKTLKVVIVQNPEQRNRDLILHCVDAG